MGKGRERERDGEGQGERQVDKRTPTMASLDLNSPLNSAAGFVPLSSSRARPIVIEPERQITDEELESQAAFVRLRNIFRQIDDVDNGVLNHRQTIHDACMNVRRMKEKVHRFEAEFWGKEVKSSRSSSSSRASLYRR